MTELTKDEVTSKEILKKDLYAIFSELEDIAEIVENSDLTGFDYDCSIEAINKIRDILTRPRPTDQKILDYFKMLLAISTKQYSINFWDKNISFIENQLRAIDQSMRTPDTGFGGPGSFPHEGWLAVCDRIHALNQYIYRREELKKLGAKNNE